MLRDWIFVTLGDASHTGVIAALVVGDQRSIPYEQWRAFTRTVVVARFRDIDVRLLRSDRDGLIRLDFGEDGVEASQYRPMNRRYWHTPFTAS